MLLTTTLGKAAPNKMRVTLVCPGFDLATLQLQPWRRVYEISKRVASMGICVTILTDGDRDNQTEKIENLTITKIRNLTTAFFFRSQRVKKVILSTSPDVVVWYGTPFSAFYLASFKSIGIPLIWDIETDVYDLRSLCRIPIREILNPINRLYTYFVTALFSRFTLRMIGNSPFINRVVIPSTHLKDVLLKKGIASDKLTIVQSTIEKEEFSLTGLNSQSEIRMKRRFDVNDFIVTYFGSPHTLRGPDIAVLSMPKILSQLKNVRLLILSRRVIGGNSIGEEYNRIEEDHLRKLVNKLGLNEYIQIIAGFMEKKTLTQYLQMSDVIVFPFRLVPSEPPLSVFEAMILGKAVITSNIGCLREISEGAGSVLIEPGNSYQLADAVLFLAKNPERLAEISQNAKKFALSLPDWDSISQYFAQLLVNVVQEDNWSIHQRRATHVRAQLCKALPAENFADKHTCSSEGLGSKDSLKKTDLAKKNSLRKTFAELAFTEKRGMAIENSVSLFSQIYHLVYFELEKSRTQFEQAMLIFSVDVDAGSRQLGLINQGKNDENVHSCFSESFIGNVEAHAIPVLAQAFSDAEVPATFAIRGQLADFSGEVIELLLDSPVKHDIGAHGYSHRSFRALSREEAEEELRKIDIGFGKFGIIPKSFVFPRNIVSHLDLLEKFGYKCYREAAGNFLGDGMFIEKKNGLFNIQPSMYLNVSVTPIILQKLLDVAISKKAPLHLWFHPWSFGDSEVKIEKFAQNVLSPFLKYAQTKKKNGLLSLDTMLSASKIAEDLMQV